MNSDQIANLAYLGLLGAVIAGSFLLHNRRNLGRTAQQASIWALIFVGVILAVGMWGDLRDTVAPRASVVGESVIEVPQQGDGHYYLTLDVNGTPVDFVIDTGASQVVLTQADAKRVGIDPEGLRYLGTANTANGTVRTAAVWLASVSMGGITDTDVRAVVNEAPMEGSLLGMSYLGLWGRIEIADGKLILTR
jgi:aspartyl protease family protein